MTITVHHLALTGPTDTQTQPLRALPLADAVYPALAYTLLKIAPALS